jgi:ABC-type antimicrobial peptide transport system permease subunit
MGEAVLSAPLHRVHPQPRGLVWRRLVRHRSFRVGFVVVLVLALAAICAPWITGIDPTAMRVRFRFRPPSMEFPFGTDNFGRTFLRARFTARGFHCGLASAPRYCRAWSAPPSASPPRRCAGSMRC